jgi:HEAT repeat protein
MVVNIFRVVSISIIMALISYNIYSQEIKTEDKAKLRKSIEVLIERRMKDLLKGNIPKDCRIILFTLYGLSDLNLINSHDVIPVLQKVLNDSDNPFARADAVLILGQLKDPSVIPLLQKALNDPERCVREQSALALGELKHPSVITLLQQVLNDSDPCVRESAVRGLSKLKDPSTIPLLQNMLKDSSDNVRISAASALCQFNHPLVISLLHEALRDSSKDVRMTAAVRLAELNDQIGFTFLLDALNDPYLCIGAALTLGRLKIPAAIPALQRRVKSGDIEARIAAADALAQLKDPSVIPFFQQVLKTSDDARIRGIALAGLVELLKDPSLLSPLFQKLLKDPDFRVRQNAVYNLGQLKDPSTIPALQEALKDSDPYVRMNAASALGQLKDPSVIPALQEALKDSDPQVRVRVADGLAQLKDPSGIRALQEALKDHNVEVNMRFYALNALAKLNAPSLIPISVVQEFLEGNYYDPEDEETSWLGIDELYSMDINLQTLKIIKKLKLYDENEIKDIIEGIIKIIIPTEVSIKSNFGWELKDVKEGVEVVKVKPGGLADKAEIKEKDIIIKIETKDVKNAKELLKEIGKYSTGSRIQLEIIREKNKIKKFLLLEK